MIQRVGQKLSHTVGGGRLGSGTALGLVQARCCGALHHRCPVWQQAVEAIDSAAKGTGHGKGDTLSAAGIQKAVCGALAAIGHRQASMCQPGAMGLRAMRQMSGEDSVRFE